MGDRALPDWMSKKPNLESEAQQSGTYKKNVLEDDLPYLEFHGTIIYSREQHDCSFLSEDLRSYLMPGSAVGFDLEWPPSFTKGKKKKVAMVQLCASEEKCFLFHVSSMSGFPPGLRTFLEDETIKKVGVGIEGDMWKLLSDYEVKMKNAVELSDLANEKLKCVEKWSLDGLVKHVLKQQLFKEKEVRCSKWDDFDLTEEQKRYAATDAYAGWLVYQKLEAMGSSGGMMTSSDLKHKLCLMASDIEKLTSCVPDVLNRTNGVEMLVEDISQKLMALKDLLMKNSDTDAGKCQSENHDIHHTKINSTDNAVGPRTSSSGVKDSGPASTQSLTEPLAFNEVTPAHRTCIMSLDISEYEVQMLEMQARQEEMEEKSALEFQQGAAMDSSSDQFYEVESDEELENAMLQCVNEVDNPNNGNGEHHTSDQREKLGPPEDEDEDIEEEEEEGFDPDLPQPNPEQIKCLKMYFGHHSFKPVQWKVIHSVLEERKDNLVVMATGYGKSLCFQFPPVYCVNISVVISPLIALMEDQVLQLRMSNVPACFLGSAQTENLFSSLKEGRFRVVYMTPEFCSGNIPLLKELNNSIGISLIAIDEAHCISQWGHDFRGAYRSLGKLKKSLPDVPIVALTATASPSIREDIVKSLNLTNPIITCTSFDRPNLYLDVKRKSGDIIQDFKQFLIKKRGSDYEFEGPSIVYCPSKKEAERVTAALSKLGVLCGVYHAGLGIKQRRETQYQFMRDEIQCVVATIAFGMGINKADIRKVIHYGAPREMELYYQEIGRAGRDGLPSACHVLWAPADMALNRFLLSKTNSEKVHSYKIDMMAKMEKYLKSTKCRRKLILLHFEDKQLRKVTSGIMGTSKCCDNCKSGPSKEDPKQSLQDFGPRAYQLMGAVNAFEGKFGMTAPVLFLRGSTSQRVPDRFRQHPLFGAGRDVAEAWWKALGRELILEKYLMETIGQNRLMTFCKLAPKGRTWLDKAKNETQRTLLLQPNQDLCPRACVPRNNRDPTPAVISSRGSSVDYNQAIVQSSPCYRADVSQVCRTTNSSSSRLVPGSSGITVACPQPPTVSPRDLELQAELYGKLVAERQKLASLKDIPPAILATNKILLDMARVRPCTESSLIQVDGVSEARATMLAPLLQTIKQFCHTHKLQVDTMSSSTPPDLVPTQSKPISSAFATPLPDSVSITYRLFQTEGKSMRQVADTRSMPLVVVESHLLQAQKANHPLDVERAGLSVTVFSKIASIIHTSPLSSDLGDLKAIRALIPEEISTFLVRLAVTKLQREGFPKETSCCSPEKQNITWIEPQKKTVKEDRSVIPPASTVRADPDSELDPIDMSEDDMFMEVPMPEDSEGPTPSNMPLSTAMELASWNQEELDKDTQDLFSDSPVKNVGQPSKRKLPEWTEMPTGQASAAATSASSKKTKKKKGLFM
ncbi:Werner syndrome ATP-dependent helicase homolog [Chanos chanos]|uniref:DNA 3'-5' helicase n=1 Tax=Chanos chanos TaxID=29144 RepID=A0A6J2UXC3_CHACN|nr:Werner syndrome ATP-dependent helicase [Chanos chanos]